MFQLQSICFVLLLFFSQDCYGAPICYERNDFTLSDCTIGSEVVEAVFAKIDCLQIFNDSDHILMKRIAYVETGFGKKENYICDGDGGGIWRLERESFDKLFEPQVKNMFRNISDIIHDRTGSRFFNSITTYEFLKKPYYSALAASLYLHYLEMTSDVKVPFDGTIEEQAEFWVDNYTFAAAEYATTDYFIMKANELDNDCTINADVLFLLDTSGSIGTDNFIKVKEFLLHFVKKLRIGPQDDQVGVVTFATRADLKFPLNKYNTLTDLNDAINDIGYTGGFTNMAEGLCHLIKGFKEGNGARPQSAAEVYKVAIILSDGIPNEAITECRTNATTYIEEAAQLRGLPVRAYVIGVTNAVNESVLKSIAFQPTYEYYRHLDSFDELQDAHERYLYEICKKASNQAEINQTINGTLGESENVRVHFPIPDVGITVEVCVSEGHVTVYGSVTIPNPNSAFFTWMFEVVHEEQKNGTRTCLAYFFEINSTTTSAPPTPSRVTSRDTDPTTDDSEGLTDRTLYISVEGLKDHNKFSLNGTRGNTCNETQCVNEPPPPPPPDPTDGDDLVPVIVGAAMSGLVIIILCILILILVRGYQVHRRKKKIEKEDEYSLLSESINYVSFN